MMPINYHINEYATQCTITAGGKHIIKIIDYPDPHGKNEILITKTYHKGTRIHKLVIADTNNNNRRIESTYERESRKCTEVLHLLLTEYAPQYGFPTKIILQRDCLSQRKLCSVAHSLLTLGIKHHFGTHKGKKIGETGHRHWTTWHLHDEIHQEGENIKENPISPPPNSNNNNVAMKPQQRHIPPTQDEEEVDLETRLQQSSGEPMETEQTVINQDAETKQVLKNPQSDPMWNTTPQWSEIEELLESMRPPPTPQETQKVPDEVEELLESIMPPPILQEAQKVPDEVEELLESMMPTPTLQEAQKFTDEEDDLQRTMESIPKSKLLYDPVQRIKLDKLFEEL